MNQTQNIPDCPPGLEHLTTIDQILVHQQIEFLEVFTGFETRNRYVIKNGRGQKIYYAVEESDVITRNCVGSIRPFDMMILDNFRHEVIHLYRPLACGARCLPFCLQSMEIYSPPDTKIGFIKQEWNILYPSFSVKNATGYTVLKIKGPFFVVSCGGNIEFRIMSHDGSNEVGRISKHWGGLLREIFTDADNFGITFPMDLDVRSKALMLGACILIDFMFFEDDEGYRRRHRINPCMGTL